MQMKTPKLLLYKMIILSFKAFMKQYKLKNKTMNESELQKVYIYSTYPRDSTIFSGKSFVNIDVGGQDETHWTCFIVKDNRSYYFDSFGGQPDRFFAQTVTKTDIIT